METKQNTTPDEAQATGDLCRIRARANFLKPRFGRRRLVGVDIAGYIVHVAEVVRRGSRYIVKKSGRAVIDAKTGPRCDAIAAAVKLALKQARIRTRHVVANVPGDPVEYLVKTYPHMPLNELENAIERQGRENFDAPVAWDYAVADYATGLDVTAAFVRESDAFESLRALQRCKLEPVAVYPTALALAPTVYHLDESDQTAALVHCGANKVSVVIFDQQPVVIRELQLEKALQTPEYLVQEINRTFLYFKQQCRGKQIGTIYVSQMPFGADELLAAATNAEVVDIAAKMGWEQQVGASPVAAALAVAGMTALDANLVPEKYVQRRSVGTKAAAILAACFACTVIFAAAGMALDVAEANYRKAVLCEAKQAAIIAPINKQYNRLLQLKQEITHKHSLKASLTADALPWPHILWALGRIVPPDVVLTSAQTEQQEADEGVQWQLTLSGRVPAGEDREAITLSYLMDKLRQSQLFSRVQLLPLQGSSEGGELSFTIECILIDPAQWMS